jgi:hypothetical protein
MIYEGYILPMGSTVPKLSDEPSEAALAALLAMVPVALYSELLAVLPAALADRSLESASPVALLCALRYNAASLGALADLSQTGLPALAASDLMSSLTHADYYHRRKQAAESRLRSLVDGEAYDAFVDMGIAYDSELTYVARVAYLMGLEAARQATPDVGRAAA